MDIVIVGIDLGKNSCSLARLAASGPVVLRRRMRRGSLESFVKNLGRCVVAMEACCGAHHLGRVFAAQGILSPIRKRACLISCIIGISELKPANRMAARAYGAAITSLPGVASADASLPRLCRAAE
jgi:hypothetical protein